MKSRYMILFVLSFILFSTFFVAGVSNRDLSKSVVSGEVYDHVEKEGKVRVMIKLSDDPQIRKGVTSLLSSDAKKKIFSKISSNKIIHDFNYVNGFSAYLTKEDIDVLASDPSIEQIYYDRPVKVLLQDSVGITNATNTWNLNQNNLNLTGQGQTVCIIDTGVNYTHLDLGGCRPTNYTYSGSNQSKILESEHNYSNDYDYTWNITMSGYPNISAHFVNISLEYQGQSSGYDSLDRVVVYDGQMRELASYHGINGVISDVWTPYSNGDTIYIRLYSDNLITGYGFYIDKVRNGTSNTQFDWSSCNKVIGGWDFVNNDGNPMDDNGHGTHVAGIVAANGSIKGIAPSAKIVAAKALDSDGGGWTSDVVAAIDFCTNVSSVYNISVISMSIGDLSNNAGYCDSSDLVTSDVINASVAKGISVVVAAGNEARTLGVSSPACMRNAISVGSTDKSDSISSFSNRYSLMKLFAPGGGINSTMLLDPNVRDSNGDLVCSPNIGYCSLNGTSMATPHVSAAIAIINQYLAYTGQSKTPREIESILNSSGKKITDSSTGLTYSRINIYDAIISLDNQNPSVNLITPVNDSNFLSTNQTFSCNATDLSLKNMTFYIWNSSGAGYNITNRNISGASDSYSINLTNMPLDSYKWNCYYYDQNGNIGRNSANYTFSNNKKRVILVGMDGIEVAHFNRLLAAGNLTNFATLISNGWNGTANITGHTITQTAPGNAELFTGLNQTLNNVTNNTVRLVPDGKTVYERLKAYNSNIKTGLVYGKTTSYIPYGIFANSLAEVDWKYNISQYNSTDWRTAQSLVDANTYVYSENVSDKASEFISLYANSSFFLVVYFGVPDGSGHKYSENSTQYELALINADNGLGRLLTYLNNSGILSDTEIMVSADHGWDINGTGHTSTSNSKIIPLLTNNVNLTVNNTDGIRKQCDIAPTILDYFGIDASNYSDIGGNGCYSMLGDGSPVLISVNSPSGSYSSSSIVFNISVNKEASSCNFSIDAGVTNRTMESNDNLTFSSSLSSISNGNYEVSFYCGDLFEAVNDTTTSFSVSVNSNDNDNGGSSSNSGGGGASTQSITLNEQQINEGVTKSLGIGDKISFSSRQQNHSLTINKIINQTVNLTIRSDPINIVLSIGQSTRLNLTNAEFYDLFVKLENISNGKANITIKAINESTNPVTSDKSDVNQESKQGNKIIINEYFNKNKSLTYLWVVVAVAVLVLIIYLIKRKNNRAKNLRKR